MNGSVRTLGMAGVLMAVGALWAGEQELPDVALPAPRMTGGKPLLQALSERQTARVFDTTRLPERVVGDLLWAAAGINRAESGKRTFPSAKNRQTVQVYVVNGEGAFRYDAKAHALRGVAKGDFRTLTGRQSFVARAPLHLIYVADFGKLREAKPDDQILWSGTETGCISQNVYLFCASEGLATVVRTVPDPGKLSPALKLGPAERVMLAQTVGYPGKRPTPAP